MSNQDRLKQLNDSLRRIDNLRLKDIENYSSSKEIHKDIIADVIEYRRSLKEEIRKLESR